ncbi:MAG: undecaprenyl-diphosphate phosphatase [Pigmentiphaga sp.]
MDLVHVLVLAIVQGVTEFLPVSSSAHLVLAPVLLGWPDQGLSFDVALHLGSLFAIFSYFRHDIFNMAGAWVDSVRHRRLSPNGRLAWAVLLGTIPVGLAGLLFGPLIAHYLRSPVVLAWSMIVFGIILAWADWRSHAERTVEQITWRDVVWIALAQAVALIPGTSRSGITLTAGLFVGLSRQAAARFSFLLAIPVIVLASLLQFKELTESPEVIDWTALAVGTVASAIASYLCIKLFLAFIQRIGVMPFVIYRIVLGVILLMMFS